jgi:hypothetical protein
MAVAVAFYNKASSLRKSSKLLPILFLPIIFTPQAVSIDV